MIGETDVLTLGQVSVCVTFCLQRQCLRRLAQGSAFVLQFSRLSGPAERVMRTCKYN